MRNIFQICVTAGAAALLLPTVDSAENPSKKPLPVSFCEPASAIAEKAEECEQNDIFIAKAEQCLDRLEKEVSGVAKAMKGSFAKDAEQKQNTKFQSTLQDYSLSSDRLAYLIGLTGLAIKEMEDYKKSLALPEDADEPEVNQGNLEGYIQSVECYGDSKESLADISLDFQDMLKQLEAAKTVADAHAASSSARDSNMGANASVPAQELLQSKSLDSESAKHKGRASQLGDSKVTGEKELEKAKLKNYLPAQKNKK